jgi:hypothetical protein
MCNNTIPESDILKRKGGNLVIWSGAEVAPTLSVRLPMSAESQEGATRQINTEDFARYQKNSLEKANRMSARFSSGHNDFSSWQTRVFDAGKYGGAVKGDQTSITVFISFSGFAEHDDEYFCIALSIRLGFLSKEDAVKIMKFSKNPWLKIF